MYFEMRTTNVPLLHVFQQFSEGLNCLYKRYVLIQLEIRWKGKFWVFSFFKSGLDAVEIICTSDSVFKTKLQNMNVM